MDLLSDGEDDQQPMAETRPPVQPTIAAPVPVERVAQQVPPPKQYATDHDAARSRMDSIVAPPAKPSYKPPVATNVPGVSTSSTTPVSTMVPPQQQQQQSQQHNRSPKDIELLTFLIRAELKKEQSPERELLEHIRVCRDGNCPKQLCPPMREIYQHYELCNKENCNRCTNTRLYTARFFGTLPKGFEEIIKESRKNLAEAISRYKQRSSSIDAKSFGGAEQLRRETEELNEAKSRYDEVLRKVYACWIKAKEINASSATGPTMAVRSSDAQLPAASSLLTSTNATNSISSSKSSVKLPATSPFPTATQAPAAAPKRSDEFLKGHILDFVTGDGTSAILQEFESILESLTTTVAKPSAWRTLSDFTEPDWSENNVLSKRDIEYEQTRTLVGTKRLFSNHEMEYVSRATQELLVDIVMEAAHRVKHAKVSGDDSVLIDADMLRSIFSQRSALALLNL